jgi:hypothetical protein
MTSAIHDRFIDMLIARWDCVNTNGPCDCDNGVNAARVASREYARRRREFPMVPRDERDDQRSEAPREAGSFWHRMFTRLAEWTA